MKQKFLLSFVFILLPMMASAWTQYEDKFTEIDGIYYELQYVTKVVGDVKTSYYEAYVACKSIYVIESLDDVDESPVSANYSGSLVIPSEVTYNGITYPVTGIWRYAFYGCSDLTSISFPSSITTISPKSFVEGTAWYNNQPDGLVYAGNILYKYKGTMPENASITLRDGTSAIIDGAFSGCSNLFSITIPNSVQDIGYNAFNGCI